MKKQLLLLIIIMSSESILQGKIKMKKIGKGATKITKTVGSGAKNSAIQTGSGIKTGAIATTQAIINPKETWQSTVNELKDAAKSIEGFIVENDFTGLINQVQESKQAQKDLKENGSDLIKGIIENISRLENLFSSEAVKENLKVLLEVKNVEVPQFPQPFSMNNFASGAMTEFMDGLNNSYAETQKSIEALFNLMTISFQAFALASTISVDSGILSDDFGKILKPLPIVSARKTGTSFVQLGKKLRETLPAAFVSMSASVNELKLSFIGVNQNIGSTILVLQEQTLALQHALSLLKLLGGKSSTLAPPPPPPPLPPAPPMAPPSQLGPPTSIPTTLSLPPAPIM